MGKIISAFIAVESCSVFYVHQFVSLAISSIKCFLTDPEGNKKSDFLQRTTVLYASLIFCNVSYNQYSTFSSVFVSVIDMIVDTFSVVFEMKVCVSMHVRRCCCNPRSVIKDRLQLLFTT